MSSRKKNYIIVSVIAILLASLFGYFYYKPPANLQESVDALITVQEDVQAARKKAQDAKAKVIAIEIALILEEDWYQNNNQSYAGFIDSALSRTKIDNTIVSDGDDTIVYTAHTTKENYVIKAKSEDSDRFYCVDVDITPTEILISGNNFEDNTNCKGIPIL